jgi:signal transduction histidine kinase
VDGFEKRCGIAVNLELDITERQAPEMETMLFRVVQECLINIHRHSGSAVASIRLSHTERQLIMEVEDEGRGLTVDELSAIASGETVGVGLRGMRERVSDFGGELEVISTGQGAKVRAVIPIDVRSSRTIPAPAADTLTASEIAKRAAAR